MTDSYHEALNKLLKAQESLSDQNISTLPTVQQLDLEKSKAAIYAEIQALQTTQMSAAEGSYTAVTTTFSDCKASLQNLSDWLAEKEKTDGEYLSLVSKGVGLALSLLA